MTSSSLIKLKSSDIDNLLPEATSLMKAVRYTTSASPGKSESVSARPTFSINASTPIMEQFVDVISVIHQVSKDDDLPTEAETHILRAIRKSIAISKVLIGLYEQSTEFGQLKAIKNSSGRLTETQNTVFQEYQYTAGLITAFVTASYVNWRLQNFMDDISISDTPRDPNEFSFENPSKAINAFLWELSTICQQASSQASLVKLVREYCFNRAHEVSLRVGAAKYLETFLNSQYTLEDEDFVIHGFEMNRKKTSEALVMQFRKPEEVVGNHIAKHQCQRLARQLLAYDFGVQKSPFTVLGGHTFTFMGDGLPGTGKTTIIQMLCGLINDYCQMAGYVFRYRNFGVDQISEYQGVSGRNCASFIEYVMDPHCIGFGTIDDIDQIAGKRSDNKSSGGQQEVTAALMSAFAGANTVVRGNCTFGMFSNYPENVDDALRQRAGARFLIDGPKTFEDFRDLAAILLGNETIQNLGLGDSEGKLFLTQQIQIAVKAAYEKHNRPQEKSIEDIFDRLVNEIGPLDNFHKLCVYLMRIHEHDPRFTGRAIKNVMDSVKTRAMDFDMPDDWFENPEVFIRQDLDTKISMIKELMQPISIEMVLQQINQYADSEARYSDKSFTAEVDAAVRNLQVQREAMSRFS